MKETTNNKSLDPESVIASGFFIIIIMTEQEQRKLAANIVSKLDPSLANIILDNYNCYDEIINAVKPYRDKILGMWQDTWPQVWAYRWAFIIGDRNIMRDWVTESKWAYRWACDVGDKDVMRPIVFKDPYWKDEWVKHFGE